MWKKGDDEIGDTDVRKTQPDKPDCSGDKHELSELNSIHVDDNGDSNEVHEGLLGSPLPSKCDVNNTHSSGDQGKANAVKASTAECATFLCVHLLTNMLNYADRYLVIGKFLVVVQAEHFMSTKQV